MQNVLNYFLDNLILTGLQILLGFGPMLFLAFIMNFIAGFNEKMSYKLMGQKSYLYTFGWLGTAVHELGHAFFALVFFHKITDIQLFSPKGHGGSLGYVAHSYNKRNIYHRIGNFFIGLGPILFGSLVLFFVAYLLFNLSFDKISSVQFDRKAMGSFQSFVHFLEDIFKLQFEILRTIFYGSNSIWWKMLIFLYILFSVGSSVTLSKSDISSSVGGFLFFVIVLLLFNLATTWYSVISNTLFTYVTPLISIVNVLILFAMLFNLIFSLILFPASILKSVISGK